MMMFNSTILDTYVTQSQLGFAQKSRTEKSPHIRLPSLRFQEGQGLLFRAQGTVLLDFGHLFRMCSTKLVQPTETVVEARHVMILPGRSNRFLHCCDCFRKASKVRLEDGKVQQSILIQ